MKRLTLADPVILAHGWHRVLIAFLAGAASTLALPPVDLWPAMFVTFPLLIWLLDGVKVRGWRGVRMTFTIGWWFGFGYFLAGLYWIGAAFLVDARTFGWLLPIAVTAMPAGLALFTGVGFAAARAVWTPDPFRILTFAAALSSVEWLRGHLFTGFPWNTFGYALTASLPLAQTTALLGIWGLTFIAVAVFAAPALLANGLRQGAAAVGLVGAVLLAMSVFGTVRLGGRPTAMVSGVHLRIMQPNIAQDGFVYGARSPILTKYIRLSQGEDSGIGSQKGTGVGLQGVTHLIWPESAFPFFLTREPDAVAAIAAMLPPTTVLLTGGIRPVPNLDWHAFNSVYEVSHAGTVRTLFDKLHLVPFGEYVPFEQALTRLGLTQLVTMPGGFVPGSGPRRMTITGAPDALPLVCYEAIFPDAAVPVGERPGWLLNFTNDAWFGVTAGPYQHFQQARVRAIEEGLALVRAANSGISAVVDPLGRIVAALPLGREGLLDTALPAPLPVTVYGRIGDLPFIVIAAMILSAGVISRIRREFNS